MDTLKAAFEKATSEKLRCQDEVNHTNNTIKLANRLVKGLEVRIQYACFVFWTIVVRLLFNEKFYYTCNFMVHTICALLVGINHLFKSSACFCEIFQSENVRWVHSVAQYREQESTLCGDVLLTAAFISYAGTFSKRYREELLHNLWMPYLRAQKVSVKDRENQYSR